MSDVNRESQQAALPSKNGMTLESAIGYARAAQAQHPSEITDSEEACIVFWRECERLTEALKACETHDYRALIEAHDAEVGRLRAAVQLALRTWGTDGDDGADGETTQKLVDALRGCAETEPKHRFTAEAKEGYCIHCSRVMGEHSKGNLYCPETARSPLFCECGCVAPAPGTPCAGCGALYTPK